jgi:WD40 repeat protein
MGGIYSIAVNPQDNRQFATGGWDGKIQLWRIKEAGDRQLIRSINAGNTAISQVAFSPDGKLLASANWNRTIGLWDAQTGKSIATLTGHRDGINSIAWSNQDPESDSYWLVSGSEDKTVKIWQIINNQPKLLHTLTGHQDSVKIVAFSPDGRLIASGSYDKTIKLWQIDGRLQQTLTGHKLAITSLSFSSDGRTLASGSADNTIKLWQINRDRVKLSKTLTGHQMGITSLAYSSNPNLDWLASASSDRTIKLWNPHNGILLKTLQGHPSQINSLAVVDLGQSLLSADEQEGLYFWNLDLEKSISQGCARLNNYLLYDRNLSKLDRSICN